MFRSFPRFCLIPFYEVMDMEFLVRLSDSLWNPWLLGLFFCTGLVFTLGSGCFPLFGLPLWLKTTLGSLFHERDKSGTGLSSLEALATALASTMGTGSIAGVSTALTLGGPGAVLWMWVSAFLGMMTSCGEKMLAVRYQASAPGGGLQGGPMFYLRDGLGSPLLAGLFSLACLPATLAGGNLVQSSSIAASLESAFGFDRLAVGLVTALLTGLVMVGGIGRIARVSSALVPVMALLYLGGGGYILIARAHLLPQAIEQIFTCALCPQAALGGGMGWTVQTALRYGVARGVFTNEAGLGTSAMAHGAARVDHPARQGMWGIFEVFLSTLVVCTVTALVILVSDSWSYTAPPALSGAPLTAAAFGCQLGGLGEGIVSLSLLLFAFSSLLGWSYYGQQSLHYLVGDDRFLPHYRAVFLVTVVAGALGESNFIWTLVDLCNACLALPNLAALLLLAPQCKELLDAWICLERKKTCRPL